MTGIMQMIASDKVPSVSGTTLSTIFDFSNPPQLVSAQFNGTSHQLLANSSVFTRTTDFTVEGWYYAANVTGTHYLFTLGTEAANRYSYFLSGNAITSNIYGGNSISYSSTVSINTWNHIAVVRSGSTVKLFLNGNASATTDTQSGTIGTGNLRIGADSGGLNRFQGNISNFRVSDSAVYINDFTRSTRPFLANGNVAITSTTFANSAAYLSVPASTAWDQTGSFTVDWFARVNDGSNQRYFWGQQQTGGLAPFVSVVSASTFKVDIDRYSLGSVGPSTTIFNTNTWYHMAITFDGTNLIYYVNGVACITTTNALTLSDGTTGILEIGNYLEAYGLPGNISNFRWVKGVVVYTGNFNPPANGLTTTQSSGTNISAITAGQTQLLLPLTATPFTDVSTNLFTVTTVGNITTANTSVTNTQFLAPLGVTPFTDDSKNGIAITNVGTVVLANISPFSATWVDSVSNISATVATNVNSTGQNPTYDGRYGGGIYFNESPRQTYVDVPTSSSLSAMTISIAAVIPNLVSWTHYVAVICGNTGARTGNYVMSRNWTGDGLEFGTINNWAAVSGLTMGQLAWYDYVWNGSAVTLYKNGTQIGSGTLTAPLAGWLNPLRFGGDEAVASGNTMAPGLLYRMIHWNGALTAGQVTAQFNTVRALYGL